MDLQDPCFYLVDFDFEADQMVFSRARVEWFMAALRLSARDLPLDSLTWVPAREVLRRIPAGPAAPTLNYLFHLPFCGSSFLTRYLETDAALLLRDPASLDAVFRKQPGARYPPAIARLRHATLALLNRPLAGRATVVRTAGYHPGMIRPLARSATFRAAVFLYSDLEHYLAQVLKSSERRRQARVLLASRPGAVREAAGAPLELLTDAAVVALFWRQAVESALAVAEALPRGAFRTLDCEALFARPDAVVARVGGHFGLEGPGARPELRRALKATHAKTGEAFTPGERRAVLKQARAAHAEEFRAARELVPEDVSRALLSRLEALGF